MKNETQTDCLTVRIAIFGFLAVLLATLLLLHLSGRSFERALADGGLSVALPMPTRILLEQSWILLLIAVVFSAWSCTVARLKCAATHVRVNMLSTAAATMLFQGFGVVAYIMPLSSLIR